MKRCSDKGENIFYGWNEKFHITDRPILKHKYIYIYIYIYINLIRKTGIHYLLLLDRYIYIYIYS